MNNRISSLILAATLATASPLAINHQAFALDGQNLVEKLEKQLEANGADVTYDSAQTIGDTISISNVTIKSSDDSGTTTIKSLELKGVVEKSDGEFTYGSIIGKSILILEKDESTTKIEMIDLTGLDFDASLENKDIPAKADKVEITNLLMQDKSSGNVQGLTIPSISAEGFIRTSDRNFKFESARIAPFQGRMFDKDQKPTDISFGGASVSDFEYFGFLGFDIGEIELGAFSVNGVGKDGPVNMSFEGMRMENYYTWDASDDTRPLIPDNDIKIELKPMSVSVNGKEFMSWAGGGATAVNDAEALTSVSAFRFEGMKFDFSAVPLNEKNAQQLQPMFDLGYEKLVMNIALNSAMDLKNGTLDISKMNFDFEEAGSLNMAFKLTGYTEQVAKSIASAASRLQGETDKEKQQALGLQLFAMMAPLSISNMQVDVSDASLLNKVVNYQAKKLNQEPAQVSGIIAPMASIALAPLQAPEFAAAVSAALGTFMQGNKTISARIDPEGGLAMTEIIALSSGVQAGSIKPAEMIDRLNLTVTSE